MHKNATLSPLEVGLINSTVTEPPPRNSSARVSEPSVPKRRRTLDGTSSRDSHPDFPSWYRTLFLEYTYGRLVISREAAWEEDEGGEGGNGLPRMDVSSLITALPIFIGSSSQAARQALAIIFPRCPGL